MLDATHALLAVMAEHHPRRADLVAALVLAGDASLLADSPAWRPSAGAIRRAGRQLAAIDALGIHVVPLWQLPPRLARVRPLPPALFVRGSPVILERRAVAVVGARKASPGPLAWASACATAAAREGWLVVSGGARGIDGAAHRAALAAGSPTVVFLGVAVDRVYPAVHRRLFERVLASGGAIVSEHPPLTPSFAASHQQRNRFIAAHAEHVLVAEAAETSGSLGTATHARRLGVPVWVPPPAVGGERAGIELLLRAGHARTAPEVAALPRDALRVSAAGG